MDALGTADVLGERRARGAKSESRGHRRNFDAYYVPPGPSPENPSAFPVLIRASGNPDIDSEDLIAYEAGWRMQMTPKFSVDVATFFNDYDDLILGSPNPGATFFEATPAPPHLVTPVVLLNSAKAHSYGGELALNWQPVERVRLAPFYSYLQVDAEQTVAGSRSLTTLEDSAPRHQFGLRSSFDLTKKLKLDVNLRWVDEVPAYNVSSYLEVDVRVAWTIRDGLELAVAGQNLLDNQHAEFGAQTIEPRYELERGVYAKLTWRF
ncbi:MAG: TonB-dependent receptor [Verrucomicrobiota bacterium]